MTSTPPPALPHSTSGYQSDFPSNSAPTNPPIPVYFETREASPITLPTDDASQPLNFPSYMDPNQKEPSANSLQQIPSTKERFERTVAKTGFHFYVQRNANLFEVTNVPVKDRRSDFVSFKLLPTDTFVCDFVNPNSQQVTAHLERSAKPIYEEIKMMQNFQMRENEQGFCSPPQNFAVSLDLVHIFRTTQQQPSSYSAYWGKEVDQRGFSERISLHSSVRALQDKTVRVQNNKVRG